MPLENPPGLKAFELFDLSLLAQKLSELFTIGTRIEINYKLKTDKKSVKDQLSILFCIL